MSAFHIADIAGGGNDIAAIIAAARTTNRNFAVA
jgi:hypothetical protein